MTTRITLSMLTFFLLISNYVMASDIAISEGEIKSSIDKMVLSKEYKGRGRLDY